MTDYQNEILNLYDAERFEGEERKGRRYIQVALYPKILDEDLTPKFMEKIRENVQTSFYARHVYSYKLRNILKTGHGQLYYYTDLGSPWMNKLAEAEKWLSEKETKRLDTDSKETPNTKWVFDSHYNVDVKVVLDRQPLMGTGPLPDWLRNLARGAMVALQCNGGTGYLSR